jgi:hypothetical protein
MAIGKLVSRRQARQLPKQQADATITVDTQGRMIRSNDAKNASCRLKTGFRR